MKLSDWRKKDCFAYNPKKDCCKALTVFDCKNCKFYKNQDEYIEELEECFDRLKELGLFDKYKYKGHFAEEILEESGGENGINVKTGNEKDGQRR